jgi:hypothetical protein
MSIHAYSDDICRQIVNVELQINASHNLRQRKREELTTFLYTPTPSYKDAEKRYYQDTALLKHLISIFHNAIPAFKALIPYLDAAALPMELQEEILQHHIKNQA